MIKYNFWITKELLELLKKAAIKQDRTTAAYMRLKLKEAIKREEEEERKGE